MGRECIVWWFENGKECVEILIDDTSWLVMHWIWKWWNQGDLSSLCMGNDDLWFGHAEFAAIELFYDDY